MIYYFQKKEIVGDCLMKKVSFKSIRTGALIFAAILVLLFIFTLAFGDSTPPVIEATEQTISYGTTLAVTDIASGTDNRSKEVTLSIEEVSPGGPVISEDGTSITFDGIGDYTLTILGTDQSNNQTEASAIISVVDEIPPEFLETSDSLEVGYGTEVAISASKEDENAIYAKAEDEITDVTILISAITPKSQGLSKDSYTLASGTAQFNEIGDYDVELRAQDDYGNMAVKTIRVSVVDKTAPALKGLKASYVLAETDEEPDYLDGVTAVDEIDGDLTDCISLDAVNVSYGVVGDYTVSYSVADNAGNITTESVPVTIKDTTPPTLSLSETSFTITAGDSAPDYSSGVSAYDTQDGNLISSVTIDDSEVDYNTPGTYEVTYRIADNSGNATKKTASVTVKSKQTASSSTSSSGSGTVYITNYGEKYHTGSCRYLSKSKIAISKSEAIAQGYEACKVCKP